MAYVSGNTTGAPGFVDGDTSGAGKAGFFLGELEGAGAGGGSSEDFVPESLIGGGGIIL